MVLFLASTNNVHDLDYFLRMKRIFLNNIIVKPLCKPYPNSNTIVQVTQQQREIRSKKVRSKANNFHCCYNNQKFCFPLNVSLVNLNKPAV